MTNITCIQPALPPYRTAFFQHLAVSSRRDLRVYHSICPDGMPMTSAGQAWTTALGPIRRVLPGLFWQTGALSVPMAPGDIVVVSGAPRCLSNLVLLWRARLNGTRCIWWGHYWSSTSRQWRLALRLMLMRSADALLFYTDREVAAYRERRPNDRRPIAALNNGIDTAPIQALRAPYDAVARQRAFLFIGRVTVKARLGLALDALARPEAEGINLHVIGSGDHQTALMDKATRLGLAARVHWHGGTIDEAQIAAVANRCRAFLYPGEVGLSLIHAMAYGLPALVHDDPRRHMPEIAAFTKDETGQTFIPGDPASMAVASARMIDDTAQLDRCSARCLEVTRESYNTEDMARRFLALVEALQ